MSCLCINYINIQLTIKIYYNFYNYIYFNIINLLKINDGTVWAQSPLGVQLGPFDRLWLENRVIIRVKSGTLLEQLDPTKGAQQPSSEIGFKNWVWAFEWPTRPCDRPPFVFYVLLFLII